ncbi:MAG: carbon-nitrogen hydrolase family protein [Planctomycetota bacterium]
MKPCKISGCWLGVAALALLAAGLPAWAEETPHPEQAKKQGKTGSRMVGVSSICHPDGRTIPETEKLIDAAALDKPDLILLTEGCMQNSSRSATRQEKDDKSDPLPQPGPITQFLSRKAQQYHTYIFASYWRKAEKGPGRYNSAVLFDREGKVLGYYDKTFPTIGEIEDGVIPGRGAVVFDTDFGRIGAMICFDFNFMELLAEYKKLGAELICFLSNYRAGKLIPAAALRNQCFIASAVPGENGVIVDPLGRTLAESSAYGKIIFARINLDSCVVHIDFNIDRVRRMKEKYGPYVQVETASPEAVYFLTSLHPEKTIGEMIKEFEVETLDAYLERARNMRKQYLPGGR